MGKKSTTNLFHCICFILFIIWAIGTVLAYFKIFGSIAGTVENILRICALIVLVYCAYLYYCSHKTTLVKVLFWFSVIVGIVAVVLPILGI